MKFIEKICAACLTSFLVCAIVSQAIPQSGFTRAPKTNAKDAEILTADSQSPSDEELAITESIDTMEMTPNSEGATVASGSANSGSWSGTLKCEACKLVAKWLLGKATSASSLKTWLDGKCDGVSVLANSCKQLIASQIQKITSFNGTTDAQLCKMTISVC